MTPRKLMVLLVATLAACHSAPHEDDSYENDPYEGDSYEGVPDADHADEGIPDEDEADTEYQLVATCQWPARECDDEYEECVRSASRSCQACIQSGAFGCSGLCDDVDRACERYCQETDGCGRWSFTAVLGDPDPAILEACEMASARNAACGLGPYPEGTCELAATVETVEVSAIYECIGRTPCGEEPQCGNPEPDLDLARVACDALTACSGDLSLCDDPLVGEELGGIDGFAAWLGWYGDDVRTALVDCTQVPGCFDGPECIDVWFQSLVLTQ